MNRHPGRRPLTSRGFAPPAPLHARSRGPLTPRSARVARFARSGVVAALLLAAPGLAALAAQQSPDLASVLQRAGEMVSRYAGLAAVIISDESCTQRAYQLQGGVRYQGAAQMVATRRWKAELALVQFPGERRPGVPWIDAP